MLDKFEPYDFLGIVIPGILLAFWLPVCFPQTTEMVAVAGFPETIDVIGFTAVAVFFGHLIQAVASLLEPPLHRTWGGKPSERALNGGLGDRYLSESSSRRIRPCLLAQAADDSSHQDLFRIAMTHANGATGSRSERFNALYAYHRALIVVVAVAILLIAASRFWGAAAEWPEVRFWIFLAALLIILVLIWHRAKQQAFHFVGETLHVAERVLKPPAAALARHEGEAV